MPFKRKFLGKSGSHSAVSDVNPYYSTLKISDGEHTVYFNDDSQLDDLIERIKEHKKAKADAMKKAKDKGSAMSY